jgi:hypothetical protein
VINHESRGLITFDTADAPESALDFCAGALLDPKPRARATKTATNFSRYAQAEPEMMSWD